jgi:hypothetical protein
MPRNQNTGRGNTNKKQGSSRANPQGESARGSGRNMGRSTQAGQGQQAGSRGTTRGESKRSETRGRKGAMPGEE